MPTAFSATTYCHPHAQSHAPELQKRNCALPWTATMHTHVHTNTLHTTDTTKCTYTRHHMYINMHTTIWTRTLPYVHTQTHYQMYIHTLPYVHTMHTTIWIHTLPNVHTHILLNVHTQTTICTHTHTHTTKCAYTCYHMYVYIHTTMCTCYVHTYYHMSLHTHTVLYIHAQAHTLHLDAPNLNFSGPPSPSRPR